MFDFVDWLWKSNNKKCPSPKSRYIHDAMKLAVRLVAQGRIELDNVWTKGYNRNNNWQQAFTDAQDLKVMVRGYIPMGLNTNQRQDVIYFIGTEVENTPTKGEQTLFVVGIPTVNEIQKRAEEHDIKHLYFGTQSFKSKM